MSTCTAGSPAAPLTWTVNGHKPAVTTCSRYGLRLRGWYTAKLCVSPTESAVAYLARHSRRIAISDQRILGREDDQVVFRYKNYRDHGAQKVMHLSGQEFIRRVLGWDSKPAVSQAEDDTESTLEGYPCPKCHEGIMRVICLLPPVRWTGH